jgi:hypothetical protein
MGKSITDVAKQILAESKDDAATSSNSNAATLRPGSKSVDVISSNPGADAPSAPDNEIQDLGPALVSPMGNSPVAKAVNAAKKDTSASSQSRKGTQSGETKQVMEEDVEISEELEDFIEEQIAAGLSEDEIAQAIEENFELVSEDDESFIEEEKSTPKVDMSEHVEALFAGEDLSE